MLTACEIDLNNKGIAPKCKRKLCGVNIKSKSIMDDVPKYGLETLSRVHLPVTSDSNVNVNNMAYL